MKILSADSRMHTVYVVTGWDIHISKCHIVHSSQNNLQLTVYGNYKSYQNKKFKFVNEVCTIRVLKNYKFN